MAKTQNLELIEGAFEDIFVWLEHFDALAAAVRFLYKEYPQSEHLREAVISLSSLEQAINELNFRITALANGDSGVRRPQTWAEMHSRRENN